MDIAFIMDPLESIDSQLETTTALMAECNNRGHPVHSLHRLSITVATAEVKPLIEQWVATFDGKAANPEVHHQRPATPAGIERDHSIPFTQGAHHAHQNQRRPRP